MSNPVDHILSLTLLRSIFRFEVLNVPEISLPYVDCFACLLLVPSVDNSCVVYYFLQFLVKKKREQRLGPEL